MNKLAATLSLSAILCLSPLKNSIAQDAVDEYSTKKEVSTLLDTLWNKDWTLTESDLEKEISKWPQELADYMKWINYVHTPLYADSVNGGFYIGFYMYFTNTYYVPIMKLNSDNFDNIMKSLHIESASNANLDFLKNINYYGLAVYDKNIRDLSAMVSSLTSYERNVNYFLQLSKVGVSHEMTHRLLHDTKGLPANVYFKQPTDEEFREYVVHLLDSDVKNILLEKFDLYIGMNGYRDMVNYYYDSTEAFVRGAFENTPEKVKNLMQIYYQYVDKQKSAEIYANEVFFSNWKEILKDTADQRFVTEFLTREITGDELDFFKQIKHDAFYRFKEKPYLTLKVNSGGPKKIIEIFYEPSIRRLMDDGVTNEEFIELTDYLRDKVIFNLLREETEALCLNSLANVYCSKPTEAMWRIDQEGYDYFSKFKIHDKPVFKRFLEKNIIARDLLRDGKDPDDIQSALEYADEYVHAGQYYYWPQSEIKIKIKDK